MKKLIATAVCAAAMAFAAVAELVPITPAHEAYLEREIMAIIHWGPNTYTGQEWGFGNASPDIVQPTDLNPAQWVKAMKAGGIKSVVLVAKHHDGFCLWPSKYNKDYSTAAIPGKFKNADIVNAVEKACRREGLEFGVYLSPWDRHQGNYGKPEYVEYFHNQWEELLSGKYGKICEIWLDGANGGDGWYGGANGGKGEMRKLPNGDKYYEKPRLLANLIKHNPLAVAFGGHGRNSLAWPWNERGQVWNDRSEAGKNMWIYARKGEDGKMYFMAPEADTPMRGGWFFHDNQHPKSLRQMVESYFASVGRGGVLNWGIAPDKKGLVCDEDVKRLAEFGDYVRKYNAVNFANGAKVTVSDKLNDTVMELKLKQSVKFNAVDFGEDLSKGQLAKSWKVEVGDGNGWREVANGPTVGWRRIARFGEVNSDRVRITVNGGEGRPKIVRQAVRFAPAVSDNGEVEYGETDTAKWMTGQEKEKK